jgi:hypothetical protein
MCKDLNKNNMEKGVKTCLEPMPIDKSDEFHEN